jgi:hypothetical protein
MKEILVIRDYEDKEQSLGRLYVRDENGCIIFQCECLERSYKDNKKRVSSIPEGKYTLMLEYSNRFKKDLWEIYNVPNRSECKIHSANYWFQLNGCIALGKNRSDINGDGFVDVTSSRATMKLFHQAMQGHRISSITVSNIFKK